MIKPDPKNYRLHPDRNKELIRKSLDKLGAGRSILIDGQDYIIAGNGVFEQAKKQGIKVRVIETDGTELIAVKRKDLKLKDPRRKQLAIADNSTSDSSEWDRGALSEDWDEADLEEWDVEAPLFDPENEQKEYDENIKTEHECPQCGYKY